METQSVTMRLPVDVVEALDAQEGSRTEVTVQALKAWLLPPSESEPLVQTGEARPPVKLPGGGYREPMRACSPIRGVRYEEAMLRMSMHPSQRDPKGWRSRKAA